MLAKYVDGIECRENDTAVLVSQMCDSEKRLHIGEEYTIAEVEHGSHDSCWGTPSVFIDDQRWWAHSCCLRLVKRARKLKMRVIRD